MEWQDDGIVLAVRRHGENAAVLTLLTADHGRHSGLVRGATSKRLRGALQPGNRLHVSWRARLEEHLGQFTVELKESNAAPLLLHPGRLAALSAACALLDEGFAEREPHPELFETFSSLVIALDHVDWAKTYVKWEVTLLAELGFGLDLGECAATGRRDGLVYVSPKSGRAVSEEAGAPYRHKLLPLPSFLADGGEATGQTILDGLRLTGFFLQRHLMDAHGKSLPDSRERLVARLAKDAETGR